MFKCPVCLDMCKCHTKYTLKCDHVFCKKCITTWFSNTNKSASCPLCRNVHTRPATRSSSRYHISNNNINGTNMTRPIDIDSNQDDNYYNDILGEIDNIEHVTRNASTNIRRSMVVDEIKACLKNIETANGVNNRLAISGHIFLLLKNNKWFLTNYIRFSEVVMDKLLELIHSGDPLISNRAHQWYYEIYGTSILT